MKELSFADYYDLLGEIRLPTQNQREQFSEYVSNAHSWYKHLPFFPPGRNFFVFLDPAAGCDLISDRRGSLRIAQRATRGFHYSSLPTAKYREKFGCLGFFCAEGTAVTLSTKDGMVLPRTKSPFILDHRGRRRSLPLEVLKAGNVKLTAVVHDHTLIQPFGLYFLLDGADLVKHVKWPEETGGAQTLEKLIFRCRQMREPSFVAGSSFAPDPVLHDLLVPEQLRLRGEIVRAIDRVCALLENTPPVRRTATRSGLWKWMWWAK